MPGDLNHSGTPASHDKSLQSQGKPGEYVVVARRYRPQDFGQLVGQAQVSQALANAITTNRVGHAYLFTGARGVGKTSTARIFAKALNCVKGPTVTPCGECDSCQGIASGDDVDVIEVDGASNRGIDEIRQLRSNVNIRPSRARFKIYIIDEVHMLTTQAFNALLKTLEEPPEHVKFIFCTTEADKIPITVLSRCQRFDFSPIELKSIVERLRLICQTEGTQADEEALQIIARRAAGSMRDSQSLLEQLLSFGGTRITVADVHAMLGTADSGRLAVLMGLIANHDGAAVLKEVNAAIQEGVDPGALCEQLLGYVRDVLAVSVHCPPELLLHAPASEIAALEGLAKQLGMETLLAMAQILDQTLTRLRQSTQVRTLIEVALIRLCNLEDLDALPELIGRLQDPAGIVEVGRRNPVAERRPSEPESNLVSREPDPRAPSADSQSVQKKTLADSQPDSPDAGSLANKGESAPLENADAIWRQTLSAIGDMTSEYAGRAERIAISGPNQLVVGFRKAYTMAQRYCERPDQRQRLEQMFSRLAGRNIRIDFAILPDDGREPATDSPPARGPSRRQRQQELQRHPLIRKASELFDTEIVGLRDAVKTEEADSDSSGEP